MADGRYPNSQLPTPSPKTSLQRLCILLAAGLLLAQCGPILAPAQVPTTTARPGMPVGKTLFVDGTNGSDAIAIRSRADKPFLTIQGALNAGVSGDTVQVRSGTYAEFLTLKNGVNLTFDPGASLTYTSGSGTAVSDGAVAADCVITGLQIAATGSGTIHGFELSNSASDVDVQANTISCAATTGGSAVKVSSGTLRLQALKLSSTVSATISLTNGFTAGNITALEAAGVNIVSITGGVNHLDLRLLTLTGNGTVLTATGGTNIIEFGRLSEISRAGNMFNVSGGETTFLGGSIARTGTGHAINVTGGTLNLFTADITGAFGGADKALFQSAGTLNVFPGARFDGTKTSGTITYMPVYGSTPTAFGLSLLSGVAPLSVANGGTAATTLVGARTSLGGMRTGFASGAAITAATPDFDSQFAASTDGILSLALTGVFRNFAYIDATSFRPLGDLIMSTGYINATNNGTEAHVLATSAGTFVDNVLELVNYHPSAHGALIMRRSTDPSPGVLALGVGNASASAHYANVSYLATNGPAGVGDPLNFLIAQEENDGGGAGFLSRRRMLFDGTNNTTTAYGYSTSSMIGPVGWHVNATGNVGIGTTTIDNGPFAAGGKCTHLVSAVGNAGHIIEVTGGRKWSAGAGGATNSYPFLISNITNSSNPVLVYGTAPDSSLIIGTTGVAIGNGTQIVKSLSTTTTWDPASLAVGASEKKSTITLTGLAVGDVVTAALSTITSSDWAVQAVCTAANTAEVKITNNTAGVVDLASGTLRVSSIRF